jgi:hypothetical protein
MSSNAYNPTPTTPTTTKSTRGTFMAINGKRVYIETRSLDDCLINLTTDELPQQLRDRLQVVFSSSASSAPANINKTYIPFAFDYDYENPHKTEEYKIAGFWNPSTQQYEFDDKQLVNLISKM